MSLPIEYRRLGPDEPVEPVADLITDAFIDYPVMVGAFGTAPGDRRDWLRRFARTIIENRLLNGDPCLVAWFGRAPAGAALLSRPWQETPQELRDRVTKLLAEAGPETLDFFTSFLEQIQSVEMPGKHVWLGVLGVSPDFQGKGIGRKLVEETVGYARSVPGVVGIALDTEEAKNVSIYEAFGLKTIGVRSLGDMPIHVMWRAV